MILAEFNLIEHVTDHPWPGCQVRVAGMTVTWMSSGIFSMLLVAAVLVAVLMMMARRWKAKPAGAANVLDALIVFVRDVIARPALHDKAYDYLPLLLTLFVFVLGMNLIGLLPLMPLGELAGLHIGATPTSIPTVCGALGVLTLIAILFCGLRRTAQRYRRQTHRPMWLCGLLAPALWAKGLAPRTPGMVGVVLALPMMLLELMGVFFKCFSLMIRLMANILAGHVLLAVLMMFIVQAMQSAIVHVFYVGPFCIVGSVLVDLLELMVAVLQAYIYTFLSAVFLGLYVEAEH